MILSNLFSSIIPVRLALMFHVSLTLGPYLRDPGSRVPPKGPGSHFSGMPEEAISILVNIAALIQYTLYQLANEVINRIRQRRRQPQLFIYLLITRLALSFICLLPEIDNKKLIGEIVHRLLQILAIKVDIYPNKDNTSMAYSI